MIDLTLLRNSPETVRAALARKDPHFNVHLLISLDNQLRAARLTVEELRHKKNELAQQGKAQVTEALRQQSIEVGKALKEQEAHLHELEQKFNDHALTCPNIPFDEIPSGNKESNKVIKEFGSKPTFNFPVKNHVELGESLGWIDFEAATLMAGSNFVLYHGEAVKLMYALTMFMMKNNMRHGFQPTLPPYMVNEKSLEVASNFPKFRDQVYSLPNDNLYMTPTSEVNLANIYRKQILDVEKLPIRHTAWTSCFRREAGTYGATERGLIRIHQFEKIELYTLCTPQESAQEHELMLSCAEKILQALGLHYRVSLLAAQDCSFASAKTYDIEVWMPGQQAYYEVSSCSNCTDFQARRGLMRYKETPDSKPELVHTLNSSSLALPRLMVAIMETYQQPDGTITIPEILKKEALYTE